MENNIKICVEKIGEYKKAMKTFVKGLVKSKLCQDAKGNLKVTIEKNFDKETNYRDVVLTVANETTGVVATLRVETPTRVFNKVDPTLFEALGTQLAKVKGFGKLIVE